MKKLFSIAIALLFASATLSAQNIQLHYDFGKHIYKDESERQNATLTFEHFKADNLGSWYYFIDMDLGKNGFQGAYTEISREFNFGQKCPMLAAHIEFDGGLSVDPAVNGIAAGYRFQPAALAGLAYNGHSEDWTKTWSLQLLYKQYFVAANRHRAYSSVQLTGVWGLNFLNDKLTFSGFFDLWRGEKDAGLYQTGEQNHGMLVFLTEPQLWFNANSHFSVGTEIEISNNFIVNYSSKQTFFVNPTIAVKYVF